MNLRKTFLRHVLRFHLKILKLASTFITCSYMHAFLQIYVTLRHVDVLLFILPLLLMSDCRTHKVETTNESSDEERQTCSSLPSLDCNDLFQQSTGSA